MTVLSENRIRFSVIKFVNERHKINYNNRAINYIHHRQLIIPINQLWRSISILIVNSMLADNIQ